MQAIRTVPIRLLPLPRALQLKVLLDFDGQRFIILTSVFIVVIESVLKYNGHVFLGLIFYSIGPRIKLVFKLLLPFEDRWLLKTPLMLQTVNETDWQATEKDGAMKRAILSNEWKMVNHDDYKKFSAST